MKQNIWRPLLVLALTAALAGSFSGCGGTGPAAETDPAQEEAANPNAGVTSLALTASTVAELAEAEEYPDLKRLDLTGSTVSVGDIVTWAALHPGIDVSYNVPLGSGTVPSGATQIPAEPGLDYAALTEALRYLPDAAGISLPETVLTAEQLAELAEKYEVDYTVAFLGSVLDPSVESLDLSALDSAHLEEAVSLLPLLPNVKEIELMGAGGRKLLEPAQVKTLMAAVPDAAVHYSFDLFGKTVSTTDERIEFVKEPIGDVGEPEIRAALDLLPAGTYLLLDDCGLSNEVMASIRDDYPDKKVVWRIHCGTVYNALTDDEVILMTFELDDDNCGNLKYCTEVRYIDVGHNTTLHDVSWVANMPKLECIIVSGAPVSDLSGFANCPNLEWLELCFCYYVTDLTPLAGLQNLKYLNVSCSQLEDLAPLENVPLERLMCRQYTATQITQEQQEAFVASHPDCLALFDAFNTETLNNNPYGYGWRYDDEGYSRFWYYDRMSKVFHYKDDGWYGGWKLSDTEAVFDA